MNTEYELVRKRIVVIQIDMQKILDGQFPWKPRVKEAYENLLQEYSRLFKYLVSYNPIKYL